MRMTRASLVPMLILSVLAPPAAAAPGDRPLVGTVWRWSRLVGPDTLEVPRPGRYTLELLPEGRYALRADCNTGNGAYTLEEGRLELLPGPMTAVECGPESLSDRFLRLLSKVEGVAQDGDRLVLQLAGTAGAMELEARREVALTGTAWVVRSYNNQKQAVVSVARGTSLTAVFGADGRLTGSAGCNRYTAGYEVEGEGIEIGPAASTRMACSEPEGIMAQESAFLTALSTPTTWSIQGERLQLRTARGALAVDLVSAVTGTLSYRVRSALPPDAEIRVRLEDVSLADAPAVPIGEQVFRASGRQVPLPFEVVYDPTDIDPRHTYSISARVTGVDGHLLFVTATAHHVITHDNPTQGVEIVLDRVR
jgi:uncharacterized lipoprotein YbaY